MIIAYLIISFSYQLSISSIPLNTTLNTSNKRKKFLIKKWYCFSFSEEQHDILRFREFIIHFYDENWFKGFKYDHQPNRSPISISSSSAAGGSSTFLGSSFLASFLGSSLAATGPLEAAETSGILNLNEKIVTLTQETKQQGS